MMSETLYSLEQSVSFSENGNFPYFNDFSSLHNINFMNFIKTFSNLNKGANITNKSRTCFRVSH